MKKLDTYINNYIQESLLDDDDDTIIARMDDILIEQITTQLIGDGILKQCEFHQNKNIDRSCISYDKRVKTLNMTESLEISIDNTVGFRDIISKYEEVVGESISIICASDNLQIYNDGSRMAELDGFKILVKREISFHGSFKLSNIVFDCPCVSLWNNFRGKSNDFILNNIENIYNNHLRGTIHVGSALYVPVLSWDPASKTSFKNIVGFDNIDINIVKGSKHSKELDKCIDKARSHEFLSVVDLFKKFQELKTNRVPLPFTPYDESAIVFTKKILDMLGLSYNTDTSINITISTSRYMVYIDLKMGDNSRLFTRNLMFYDK